MSEAQRRYRERNRSKLNKEARERAKEKYDSDEEYREKMKAASKRYRDNNPEKVRESQRKWRKKNSEKVKGYQRKFYEDHKNDPDFKKARAEQYEKNRDMLQAKARARRIFNEYGLTEDDYERMYEAQGGKCDICETDFSKSKYMPCIDHCHETGKVRGLLCRRCNLALAVIEDANFCNKAHQYLSKVKK